MTAKLLVVEDSRYMRMTSRLILSEAGFSVVEAGDGEEALRQVWESHPDLILLDMLLPKLGGEHVLQALRQDPATTRIPVIVVSSLPQSNADKLKEAGAMAYIEKSKLDIIRHGENLVRLVNAALHRAKAEYAVSFEGP
ncbi:MAG: response regulator [Terriglobales bacterium]|jgi:CheY-like chemotaxis protein